MKKLLLLFLIFKITGLFAQYTQIPDTNFEQKLIDLGIDSDQTINGQVLNSDIENVTYLNLNTPVFIRELTGIEGFINLETLICENQAIPTVDLSHNTKLKYLDLYMSGLQALNVSNLTQLEILICGNEVTSDYVCDCANNIQTLDLSNNLNLEYLECNETGLNTVIFPNSSNLKTVILAHQPLQSLDLGGLPGLETLIIPLNYINNLDLSNNPNLKYLDVNKSNMTSIDLSNNSNLETLYLGYYDSGSGYIGELGNDNNFSNIDISNLVNLKTLLARNIGINSIDLSNNTYLEIVVLSKNNLNNIDVSNNTNIKMLSVYDCQLTDIDLSNNHLLEQLDISFNPITYFSNINNPNLMALACINTSLQELDLKNGHNDILTYLFATENSNLSCIQIDDISYANNPNWFKDAHTIYSTDCAAADIEVIASSEITIYPNPVANYLYIENNSDIIFTRAKIYDISGKLITSKTNIESNINVSNLPNGFYILKLSNDKTSVTKKFIVKR